MPVYIYMMLFAAIQCLVMVVVMNLKRFHGKSDSVFYGYGLGLGMGCAMAFGMIYFLGKAIMNVGDNAPSAVDYVGLFLIALSFIL